MTDLHRAGQIGDPLYEDNWLNSSLWATHAWSYTTSFEVDETTLAADGEILLVFEGIKMGSHILVNGQEVIQTANQFQRFVLPLKATNTLLAGTNVLNVTFDSNIDTQGRFMACSGR